MPQLFNIAHVSKINERIVLKIARGCL